MHILERFVKNKLVRTGLTISSLAAGVIEPRELSGAQNRARRQLLLSLESVGGRASSLAHAAFLRGDPEYVNASFGRYASLSVTEVGDLAVSLLVESRRTVVHVEPREAEERPDSAEDASL